MVKSATSFVVLALWQFIRISCATAASNGSAYLDSTRSPAERADDLLRLMSWEEKIGQLGVFPEADGAFPVAYDYFPSDDQGGFGTATQYDWHLPELTRYAPLRFGFGLSYTTFNISSVSLQCHSVGNNSTVSQCDKDSQVTVSATVKNTGSRDGQEVVQLYYRPEYSQIEFPVMKLIRFGIRKPRSQHHGDQAG
ncbi:beta-glucosidase [Colletotrichum cuscutae]|uniref:beta-glucosidase n=1 Tax=Colletotrichum cuscutae TaxID=1209917 RepID=A0AAI9VAW4_9PEZI|nr:beta-glucosidase [Colletotrichum cuscutae]